MRARSEVSVVVIGAGISGLSAAWELRRAGVGVRLLERSGRSGGRIRSELVNGCVMETGPSVVSSADKVIHGLAQVARVPLRAIRPSIATERHGRLHRFRPDRPWSVFTSGALPGRTAARSTRAQATLEWRSRGRRSSDPAAWADLDECTVRDLAHEVGCPELDEHLWRPMLHGSWLADTTTTSAALVRAMTAHGLWHAMLTADGGLAAITNSLGRRLGAEYDTPVTAVRRDGRGVMITTDAGLLRADGVVVALAGRECRAVLDKGADDQLDDPVWAEILGGRTTPALLVALGVRRRLYRRELGGAYRVLMHPDDGPLAALTVASRAQQAAPRCDLVTCLFSADDAVRLAGAIDAHVIDEAREALLRLAPDVEGSLITDPEGARVVRIEQAMPLCPPGRAARIAAYRDHSAGPIALAGDDLAWPWMDSAADAGRRAARDLLRRLS